MLIAVIIMIQPELPFGEVYLVGSFIWVSWDVVRYNQRLVGPRAVRDASKQWRCKLSGDHHEPRISSGVPCHGCEV